MDKKQFILKLIADAQENIWKNELVIAFKLKFDDVSDVKIEATQEHIKRDKEYIEFLNEELQNCSK